MKLVITTCNYIPMLRYNGRKTWKNAVLTLTHHIMYYYTTVADANCPLRHMRLHWLHTVSELIQGTHARTKFCTQRPCNAIKR